MLIKGSTLELEFSLTITHPIMSLTCSKTLNSSPLVTKVQRLSMPFQITYHWPLRASTVAGPLCLLPSSWSPDLLTGPVLAALVHVGLHRRFRLLLGSSLQPFLHLRTRSYISKLSSKAYSSLMPFPTFPGQVTRSFCFRPWPVDIFGSWCSPMAYSVC